MTVVARGLTVSETYAKSNSFIAPSSVKFRLIQKQTLCTTNNKTDTTETEKKADTEKSQETSNSDGEDGSEKSVDIAEKVSQLEAELKEMQSKLLRSYAEEENVRRIAKRDVENAKAYANTKFAKALLDVADNLDRGLGAVKDAQKESEDPTLKVLLEGVEMTNKGLLKVFSEFGIQKYGAVGDVFEPTLHDALFRIPSPEGKINTIGQVVKTGYKLKDRVIRAAEVGIIVQE
eukprot:CAMPEP_0182427138 /NCGR_PEP_ID=MMETSP1167-20130531/14950_1 /TAXON_ID=2988 /ORGANISM="Mallomonas Sp, Strain CCMP3275" /LENGTH=232 /DNA_ID=CAMNT_0024609113 /DNA_START=186 /DNA_END=884 /DNA_ORIENTATION=+